MRTHELHETKHPDLFRVVDRQGNWKFYYHEPSKKYLRGVTTILDEGFPKGKGFEIWLSSKTAEEQEEVLSRAGDKGDMVHRAIDIVLGSSEPLLFERDLEIFNKLTGEERRLSDEEWDTLLAWVGFWKNHMPTLVRTEEPAFNLEEGYAGTFDAFAILNQECGERTCACKGMIGKLLLIDWKTSKKIRAQYMPQISAYAKGQNVPELLPKGQKIDGIAVVRVTPSLKCGYEMKLTADIEKEYSRFLAAKALSDIEHRPFDPEKDIQTIPDSFQVSVTRYVEPKKAVAKRKITRKPKKVTAK